MKLGKRTVRFGDSRGFTMVEIIAVLIIIAILAVVSIPYFVGMSDYAKRGLAQDALNKAMDACQLAFYKALVAQAPLYSGTNCQVSEAMKMLGSTNASQPLTLNIDPVYPVVTMDAGKGLAISAIYPAGNPVGGVTAYYTNELMTL